MWIIQAAALLSWLVLAPASPLTPALPLTQTPSTYAALGDSYAAGVGAGKYYSLNDDGDAKKCKRFDGGYPQKVFQSDAFTTPDPAKFYFKACSGDVLDGIDNQVNKINGNRVEVVTLSISGNDFGFGNVVRKCVYAYKVLLPPSQADCTKALDDAADAINQQPIWDKYQQKVDLIVSKLLNPFNQVLVITGYAKFFAQPTRGDACDNISFMRIKGFRGLKMTYDNRVRINDLVTKVNTKIFENIVVRNRNTLMVDVDLRFESHRFCEPGNSDDPIGATNDNVWFIDLQSKLEESDFEPDPSSAEDAAWAEWGNGLSAVNDPTATLPSDLQKASVFHPKEGGHSDTAGQVIQAIHGFLR
ncbi:MAG: hypothetical protein M1839_004136 [Geoglossum umbratile]|nr:MAG: hypothetical protein M1839_004136 [Geoglossum umbratile]